MIHIHDTIKSYMPDGRRYRTLYRASCDECGLDRGYLTKQNALNNPRCKKCAKSSVNISAETKKKMSVSRQGAVPWNKGKAATQESIERLRISRKNKPSWNRGRQLDESTRIKISCSVRGIEVNDFNGFAHSIELKQRNAMHESGLVSKCFELHEYRCDSCGLFDTQLEAHHKNSWKFFPEQRFDINNLVALCTSCHKSFHKIYGNGKNKPNTEQQYIEFKSTSSSATADKRTVLLIVGPKGVGKSWVCSQINDRANHIILPSMSDRRQYAWKNSKHINILELNSHIMSFIRRNSDIFKIYLFLILEDIDIVVDRLGIDADRRIIAREIRKYRNLSKHAHYSGAASCVLEAANKLLSELETPIR